MLLLQSTSQSEWVGIIVLLLIFGRMYMAWKEEQHERKETNQPHTFRDDALMLLSGLLIVGIMIVPWFFEPLQFIYSNRFVFALIFISVALGLTYLFNRKKRLKFKRRGGHTIGR